MSYSTRLMTTHLNDRLSLAANHRTFHLEPRTSNLENKITSTSTLQTPQQNQPSTASLTRLSYAKVDCV